MLWPSEIFPLHVHSMFFVLISFGLFCVLSQSGRDINSRISFSSCFVRARRLNVIIQPHLRFVYELLRWEGQQQITHGQQVRREIEWGEIAREIAALNRPYSRVV